MKIRYFEDTDTLDIELKPGPWLKRAIWTKTPWSMSTKRAR